MTTWALVAAAGAVAAIFVALRLRDPLPRILLPLATFVLFVCAWQFTSDWKNYDVKLPDGSSRHVVVLPTPWETLLSMRTPLLDGTVVRFAIASVYRVAVGFTIACALGIPIGLWAGWYSRGFQAVNPLIQALRPISPIAWIPLSVLWFGVEDAAAIFLIALSSFFPIATGTMTAVRTIPLVYVRSAQNFGLRGLELFRRVVFPACLPQILISLRIALGIAWMVIVAAEMIAVDSGLGYLIMDSRNASNYERVLGGMIAIGLIGIALDFLMRGLQRFDEVKWGFPNERDASENERVRRETDRARSAAAGAVQP